MKTNFSSLFRTLSIYALSNIINASIPFLLLPVLTHYLSPSAFGIVAMFQVILSFSLPFSGLNVEGAVSRQFFEKQKIDFPVYVWNAIVILFTSSIVVLIIYFVTGQMIETLTDFPYNWLSLIVLCAFAQNLSEIGLAVWQVQYQALKYGLFRITRTVTDISISLFFVVTLRESWQGRVSAQVIAIFAFAIITLFFLKKEKMIRTQVNREYIKSAIRFGLPLVPHVIGAIVITMSDRIFITKMVGLSATGLYAAGYQVGMIIGLFQNSFNQAWVPWFYEKLKLNENKTNIGIVKFTYMYFLLMLAGVVLLTVITPYIFDIFLGKDYSSARIYVFWIGLGFAFNGMYKMVVNYFFYIQKTYIVSMITFMTALLNLLLNYFFIKEFGPIGAAQATVIAFFFQFIVVWYMSSKAYKMPWLFFIRNK